MTVQYNRTKQIKTTDMLKDLKQSFNNDTWFTNYKNKYEQFNADYDNTYYKHEVNAFVFAIDKPINPNMKTIPAERVAEGIYQAIQQSPVMFSRDNFPGGDLYESTTARDLTQSHDVYSFAHDYRDAYDNINLNNDVIIEYSFATDELKFINALQDDEDAYNQFKEILHSVMDPISERIHAEDKQAAEAKADEQKHQRDAKYQAKNAENIEYCRNAVANLSPDEKLDLLNHLSFE